METCYAGDWRRVFTTNVAAIEWDSQREIVRKDRPGTGSSSSETGLVVQSGTGSIRQQISRVKILPMSDGSPGDEFQLRLSGWSLARGTAADGSKDVWIRVGLADLICVVGDFPGPSLTHSNSTIVLAQAPHERLCEVVALTAGSLGYSEPVGELMNFPGRRQPAWFSCSLGGNQFWQMEAATGSQNLFGMNAYWAPY